MRSNRIAKTAGITALTAIIATGCNSLEQELSCEKPFIKGFYQLYNPGKERPNMAPSVRDAKIFDKTPKKDSPQLFHPHTGFRSQGDWP